MLDLIHSPWSPLQVATLNRCQRSGLMHPFTCASAHPLHQTLIAETDGWHCPDETCDYRQDWAHSFMADPDAVTALIETDPLRRRQAADEHSRLSQELELEHPTTLAEGVAAIKAVRAERRSSD